MSSQESTAETLGSILHSPVLAILLLLCFIFFAFMAAFTQRGLKEEVESQAWFETLQRWRVAAWIGLVGSAALLFMITIVLG